MFGYVKPDNPNMYVKDVVLYKASYCGLCKSIGVSCGQKARLCLSYDLAFLSCFLHNIMNVDMKIEKQHCVIHRIKRRPVSVPTELSKRIGSLNVILAFNKMKDDVIDSKKGKIKTKLFKSAYKKALKQEPILCQIVQNGYDRLLKYEKSEGDSIIIASEFFGDMMKEIVKELSNEHFDEYVGDVAFNLGKWIYIADALDDFDKDKKKNEYNSFVLAYKTVQNKKELIEKDKDNISFIFSDILSEIAFANSKIKYYFNHDLIDNILLNGLKVKTHELLEGK